MILRTNHKKISLIGLSKEEAELTKFIYALEKEMGATRAQLNDEQKAQYENELNVLKRKLAEEQKKLEVKQSVQKKAEV